MMHPTLLHDMVTVERRVAELVGQRPTRGRRGSARPVARRRGVTTGRWWRRELRTPDPATA